MGAKHFYVISLVLLGQVTSQWIQPVASGRNDKKQQGKLMSDMSKKAKCVQQGLSMAQGKQQSGKVAEPSSCSLIEEESGQTPVATPRMILVLTGPPGAGKGTHAPTLQKLLEVPHLSTGDMLRERAQTNATLKATMDGGGLVDDAMVWGAVKSIIDVNNNPKVARGFMLDGFPRSLQQAEWLVEELKKTQEQISLIVDFEVPDSVLEERITGRWIHKASGHSYHQKLNPPKSLTEARKKDPNAQPMGGDGGNMKDDENGEPLEQRSNDTAAALTKRLTEYHKGDEILTFLKNGHAKVFKAVDATREIGPICEEMVTIVKDNFVGVGKLVDEKHVDEVEKKQCPPKSKSIINGPLPSTALVLALLLAHMMS